MVFYSNFTSKNLCCAFMTFSNNILKYLRNTSSRKYYAIGLLILHIFFCHCKIEIKRLSYSWSKTGFQAKIQSAINGEISISEFEQNSSITTHTGKLGIGLNQSMGQRREIVILSNNMVHTPESKFGKS